MNFNVVSQVRFQSKLIFQLGEDGFTIAFLIRQEFDLEGDVVEISLFCHHHLELIAQPLDGADHLFNGGGSEQDAFDLGDIVGSVRRFLL